MLAAFIGISLSLFLVFLAKFTRFDRNVSFYPSILIFIASFYILFAVMAGHSIAREVGIACIFIILALYGAYNSLFVVGFAIALHGVYDILHIHQFKDTVAPTWWAPFCATVDFVVGIWVMYLSRKQERRAKQEVIQMYAVIFKAKVGNQDSQYSETVSMMRELAFNQYNCQDFIAATEGEQEIAISYWLSETDIQNWHKDAQHAVAQKLGREKWYSSYTVEVVEIKRSYSVR